MNTRRSTTHRWLLFAAAFGLLVLVVVLGGRAATLAPTARAAEDEATAVASSEPFASDDRPNPFPTTEAMTDTVHAILEAYEQSRQPGLAAADEPIEIANHIKDVWLPRVAAARIPTPTAPPPTAVPPTSVPPTRVPPTATPQPADIAVSIWPAPSIRVARGGTLAYEIRVKNYGSGTARRTDVSFAFNGSHMYVVDAKMTKTGDWVSENKADRIVVSFGELRSGDSRTATVNFRVNGWMVDDTVLSMRASYRWSDGNHGGSGQSNWAPILVGSGNTSAAWLWLKVDPASGYAGTTHRFFTDRFAPGEGIVTWLNTPTGAQQLSLRGQADSMGRVWIDFRSNGLRPGSYSLVLYGARSNLTAVATFNVQ